MKYRQSQPSCWTMRCVVGQHQTLVLHCANVVVPEGAIERKWRRCFIVRERERVHHAGESWHAVDARIRQETWTGRIELAPDDELPVGPMLSHRWKVGPEPAVAVGGSYVLILVPLGSGSRARDECGNRILRAAVESLFGTFMLARGGSRYRAREHQAAREGDRSTTGQRTTVGSALPEAERSAAITAGLIPEG